MRRINYTNFLNITCSFINFRGLFKTSVLIVTVDREYILHDFKSDDVYLIFEQEICNIRKTSGGRKYTRNTTAVLKSNFVLFESNSFTI